ncbi:MAG: CotH kinase family protein [Chitinophagales bacterium]|nr:CotH kinase family protein [Chitinophagales bacterium]
MKHLFSILLSILSIYFIEAQVLINEYSAANYSDVDFQTGPGTAYEDWIELYNTSAASVDLSGFYLSDRLNDLTKYQIPGGVSIPANGHLLFLASGLNNFSFGYNNTNFKLTQTKGNEYVILSNPSGVIVDSIHLNYPNQENHSRGRTSDGASTWAVFDNPSNGASNTGAKTKYANPVLFSLNPGFYSGAQSLSLSTTEPNSTIRYTTNGSEPTGASTAYSGPINISSTTVIRARAFSSNNLVLPSHIETNTYFINVNHATKTISVCGNTLANLFNGNQNDYKGSLELFETDGSFLTEATGEFNKHGNDSWSYDQRGVDFIARDQFGINFALEDEIFDTKNRDEFQRVILKCGASDNYPFENGGAHIRDAYINEMSQLGDLRLDERSNEFAVVYLNGNYWGVYDIREKTDDNDFTSYYYDQDVPYIQYLKTWGGTWEEYGAPNAQNDWDNLVNFINANNMTIPANYAYVDSLYNTGSLIDYFILNSFVVCSDWLNWNTGWWRGLDPNGDKKKWRYTLWDMDATFGHYINYTGIPNQSANADPCDPESLGDPGGQGHVPIWNKLLTNDEFFSDYINRYAELSSSVFSCDSMHNLLDRMVAEIQPEMPAHIARWGGTMTEWQSNVQDIHDFIDTRCVTIATGIVDCYQPAISGPYEITVNVSPAGSGDVQLHTITPNSYPFTGTYFGGVNINLDADANTGWVFDHWEIVSNTLNPNLTTEQVSMNISSNDSIVAHFVPLSNQDTITYVVVPAGGGTVSINGLAQSTFPYTDFYNDGSLLVLSASANAGFNFLNWSMSNHTPSPNNTSPNISLSLTSNDTIYIYFDPIPLPNLDTVIYQVFPLGSGSINQNGVAMAPLPFQQVNNNASIQNIAALPSSASYTFSHWESQTHTLANVNAANTSFTSANNDTITAFFDTVIPPVFDTVVFLVDPALGGQITANGTLLNPLPSTQYFTQGNLVDISASALGSFQFAYWESQNNLLTNSAQAITNFTSAGNDTIIAHFDELFIDSLVVIMIPNNSASLNIGGNIVNTSPYVGMYPIASIIQIEASPNTGNSFNRWELNNLSLADYQPLTSFVFINQDTLYAYINTPTYINDLGEEFAYFSIMPSVNNGTFKVKYEMKATSNLSLVLRDMGGKLVNQWHYADQKAQQAYEQNLSFEAADGMYLLEIVSDKTRVFEKIIKTSY